MEHQNEIHAKLIAIMGDCITVHIKSLNAIRWDVPQAKPGVNDYMELLVKETVTLHKRSTNPPVMNHVARQEYIVLIRVPRLSQKHAPPLTNIYPRSSTFIDAAGSGLDLDSHVCI